MLQYILECIAFQLIFLIIYDLFLKRETFFQWNRFYLIATYILSMVLPWIKIEAMKSTVPQVFDQYPEFLWNINNANAIEVIAEESSFSISWEYGILFGGMFLAAIFLVYKLTQILSLRRKGEVHYFKDFTQIIVSNSAMAFSFFRSIFLGDKVIAQEHKSILQHELVHIRQRHSYDLMFFELMRIVGWFNPLVYVYQNRISELHEFIADAKVSKTHKKEQYQLLLSQVFQTQNISFVNQFFKTSLIKKRIVMLQKTKSKKIWKLKYLLLIPLVFGMLAYSAAESNTNEKSDLISNQTPEDVQLINELQLEIEQEIVEKGLQISFYEFRERHINQTLSKRNYFKESLFFRKLIKTFTVTFGDDVEEPKPEAQKPLPSTIRYESYVNRRKAFELLDGNLKYSIEAYKQDILLIEKSEKYAVESYIFEVENTTDLTGIELRALNGKMAEIFENDFTLYTSIILTDQEFAFKIQSSDSNSDLNGHLRDLNFPSAKVIEVRDIENLTPEEEGKIFNVLKKLSETNEEWELYVKDKSSTMKFVPSDNGSYLSGLNGEKIYAKLAIDSKLSKSDTDLFKVFLEDKKSQIQSENSVDRYNQLVEERRRLLKSSNDKNPIIVDLDQQLIELRRAMKGSKVNQASLKTETVPFATVEKAPIFPDCENESDLKECFKEKILTHISKNFRYPEEAQKQGIQGRVSAMFMITDEGDIRNIKTRGPAKVLEEEVERILNRLPTMTPGEQKGEKVNVMFSVPVTFKLDHQDQVDAEIVISARDGVVPFATVDEVPVFPGCESSDNKRKCFNEAMQRHISKNFNYPKEAQDKGIQGRVSIMFTIGEEGDIQNVRMRGPDEILEKEAARIIARLPKMTPGKQEGKAVEVPFSIPITFRLNEDNSPEKEVSPLGLSFKTDPIFYIDGEESSKEKLSLISPNDIESMHVLKGETAVTKYGKKAKNGVVEVSTKKENNGPVSFKLSEIAGKTPLLIINGEESELSVAQIDPDEVVTMQVLKGAAAVVKYGEKGKNGVVEIILKKQD